LILLLHFIETHHLYCSLRSFPRQGVL